VLHVFRFDLAGKTCAGDFKEEEAFYPHSGDYLISQGRYLVGLVGFVWIVGIILFILSLCVMVCHHKPLVFAITSRVSSAWKSISLVHRLEKGNQKDLLVMQFIY